MNLSQEINWWADNHPKTANDLDGTERFAGTKGVNGFGITLNYLIVFFKTKISPSPLRIISSSFTGNNYSNAALIGKTAQVDFDVWAAEGSGTLMNLNDDYGFNSVTGTLTMAAQKYLILFY